MDALTRFRSIAGACRPDSDVLEKDITFGEVRELLAQLDDTKHLLRAAGRELGQQDCQLAAVYAQLRREGP